MTRFEEGDTEEQDRPAMSLAQVGRIIREYRVPIALAITSTAVLLTLLVALVYLQMPTQHVTELDFRLTFRGAERGQYPNGTTFSSTEIVAPNILTEVYRRGSYERFLTFEDLKSSLFVVQSNAALETLMRVYRAKLADPRLAAIDRERIEQEFQEKRGSLSKAEYSIKMATNDRIRRVPPTVREKILSDTLAIWAEKTLQDKGVSLYDISILSSGLFTDVPASSYDYLVMVDVLRGKLNSVLANVNQLLNIPGAKVIRTKKTNRSLAEVRSQLNDLHAYRLQPLIGFVVAKGVSKNPSAAEEFLASRLRFARLDVERSQAEVFAIRDSLERYSAEGQPRTDPAIPGDSGTNGSLAPVLDRSFLDKLVAMSSESRNLQYRQELVNDYRRAAALTVPLESEKKYYETLLAEFGRTRPATPAEHAMIERETAAIVTEAVRATNEVNELYETLSKDLNPSTMLFAFNGPVKHTNERAVSATGLTAGAFILLLLSVPVILLATILFDRLRGTESVQVTIADPPSAGRPAEDAPGEFPG